MNTSTVPTVQTPQQQLYTLVDKIIADNGYRRTNLRSSLKAYTAQSLVRSIDNTIGLEQYASEIALHLFMVSRRNCFQNFGRQHGLPMETIQDFIKLYIQANGQDAAMETRGETRALIPGFTLENDNFTAHVFLVMFTKTLRSMVPNTTATPAA